MTAKIKLKTFFDLQEGQDFINEFLQTKKVIKTKIVPLVAGDLVEYFVCLEYEEQ